MPWSGIELTTSRLHSFIMAKVSHALNHSAMDAGGIIRRYRKVLFVRLLTRWTRRRRLYRHDPPPGAGGVDGERDRLPGDGATLPRLVDRERQPRPAGGSTNFRRPQPTDTCFVWRMERRNGGKMCYVVFRSWFEFMVELSVNGV